MSNLIKGIRMMRGLTQQEVAEKIGMSLRTFGRKEANPDTFTVGELKELAKLFEVKEEKFFQEKLT
ncbi:helix-turn-helix transcriptional regulator [uncultured Clostridium sp.]|uniref:helix-turn-helix transcriptional regulator n=1 Tax=uncultured Clostridium sp. TaxID=59620 RepID=UPI00261E07EC|nr:helix-turn-helix transcriptional regulator [uncultured Clostridium sp.]